MLPASKIPPKNLDFREKNNHFFAVEHDEVKKHLGVIFRAGEPQRSRCFEWADENRSFIIIEKISIIGTCLRTGQNWNILGGKIRKKIQNSTALIFTRTCPKHELSLHMFLIETKPTTLICKVHFHFLLVKNLMCT